MSVEGKGDAGHRTAATGGLQQRPELIVGQGAGQCLAGRVLPSVAEHALEVDELRRLAPLLYLLSLPRRSGSRSHSGACHAPGVGWIKPPVVPGLSVELLSRAVAHGFPTILCSPRAA